MKREIKFRAWDKKTKEMYTPVIDSEGCSAELWYGYEIQGQTNDPVMQYTGLKDKNGKEIYEGDVVMVDGIAAQVNYQEEYAGFFASFLDGDNLMSAKLNHPRVEVIGNIYENPELISSQE